MDYNELARRCHENAVKHGFWEDNPSDEHCLMLVIAEIAEMVEADRKGRHAPEEDMMRDGFDRDAFERHYKDTVEDEMADIAIRLLDFTGARWIAFGDMDCFMQLMRTSFRQMTVTEGAFTLCRILTEDPSEKTHIPMSYLRVWAESLGIDLERHIMMKMEYNESRPALHGKKY